MAKDKKDKKDRKAKKVKQGKKDKQVGIRPLCVMPKSSFEVHSFRVHWISADPAYDPALRLVPIINLFESDAGTRHEGAVAVLHFRRDWDLDGASHEEGSNVYHLDYPLDLADSILTLLGSGAPLELAWFEQDKRQWADLRTPFLEVGDDDEDEHGHDHYHGDEIEEEFEYEEDLEEGEGSEDPDEA